DEEDDYRQPKRKKKRALFTSGGGDEQQDEAEQTNSTRRRKQHDLLMLDTADMEQHHVPEEADEEDGGLEDDEELLGGGKRKVTLAGVGERAQQYRKVRTINNNLLEGSVVESGQRYCCPVCVRNDFASMLELEQHLDREHPNIPAKCRHCEVMFRSHKALNAHRCSNNNYQNITPGFKDLTFVDFSSEKFPLIAKNLCEQSIRTPVTSQKYECARCYRAFPCSKTLSMHSADCCSGGGASGGERSAGQRRKRAPSESDSSDVSGSDVGSYYDDRRPFDDEQHGDPRHQQQQQQLQQHQQQQQQQHHVQQQGHLRREDFFANLDLQNRSVGAFSEAPTTPSSLDKSFSSPVPVLKQEPLASPTESSANALPTYYSSNMALYHAHQQQQQQHQQMVDSGKDLADIQSIINVASSGGLFGRQLDGGSHT
uniref:C2H2-type domain-containing protein n=1 Tax=Anopheles maculatus TaxID=74869 RepID=A0A182SGS4_9DIPT